MAVNPVSLPETLRAWQQCGVTFFLREPALAAFFQPNAEIAAPRPAPLAADAPVQTMGQDDRKGTPPLFASRHEPAQERRERSLPDPVAGTAEGPVGTVPPAPGGTDAVSLPSPWENLLQKTPPAPVVWTYAELGEDLCGASDKERAACLRRVISAMNLPRGTSAFWPVSLPDCRQAPEGRFFQKGLASLSPKAVILLGTEAVQRSGLPLSLPGHFMQTVHQGRLYVLVPSFKEFAGRQDMEDRICRYLRTVLAGFNLTAASS